MTKIEPDAGSALILGRGINSITLDELASGIDTISAFTPPGTGGQIATFEFREIEDISRLRETMNISASASFAGGLGSGSAKASYLHSVSFSTYAIYTYIRVKVTNQTVVIKDYKLTDEAIDYLKNYGEDSFFENFGDEFVATTTSGGEFLAILQINTETLEEKKKIAGEMSGSYGYFSAAADFSASLAKFNFHSSTRLFLMRRGGAGALPDINGIKAAALNFPDEVAANAGNPVMIQLMTLPYAITTNRPNNIRLINIEKQRDALERLVLLREKATLKINDYRYASETPYLFTDPDVTAINNALVTCRTLVRQIDESALQCRETRGRSCVEPPIDIPIVNLNWAIPLEPGLSVRAHVEGIGDMWETARKLAGTTGQNRRCEGISVAINPPIPGLYIEYMVHGEGYGDTTWGRDGAFIGTQGQSLRIEGFAIRLIGPLAKFYDVVYVAHVEGKGDIQAQNGDYAGTRGENRRCEGLRVWTTRRV